MNKIIALYTLLIWGSCFSQDLSPIQIAIIDIETNLPIKEVKVHYNENNYFLETGQQGSVSINANHLYPSDSLIISKIGYETKKISLADYDKSILISLTSNKINKEENYSEDYLIGLLKDFITGIPDDYSDKQEKFLGTFNQYIFDKNQAVIETKSNITILKQAYNDFTTIPDQISILKTEELYLDKDTEKVKYIKQKADKSIYLFEDVVRTIAANPSYNTSQMEKFFFYYEGMVKYEYGELLVIKFAPKQQHKNGLYKGIIYLDRDTHAIAKLEYELTDYGHSFFNDFGFIKKTIMKLKKQHIKFHNVHYDADYVKLANKKWELNTVHINFDAEVRDKKKGYDMHLKILNKFHLEDEIKKTSTEPVANKQR